METTRRAEQMAAAFDVRLQQYEHDGGTYRGRSGAVSVPGELAGVVEGVFGLDDRPQATPHFQVFEPTSDAIVARAVTAS